jgi:hypothetical protein
MEHELAQRELARSRFGEALATARAEPADPQG